VSARHINTIRDNKTINLYTTLHYTLYYTLLNVVI